MTNDNYEKAASELLKGWVTGIKTPRLNEELRPSNTEDALQIQSRIIEHHDDKVGGWKCLLPLDEDKLIVAPIFLMAYKGEITANYLLITK